MYARREAWRRQRAWARRGWWVIALLVVGAPAVSVPVLLALHGAVRWAVVGATAASGIWAAAGACLVASGAASQIAGAWAERWTAESLKALTRQGWRVINGAHLTSGSDIDHIAVGPSGVLVLETKWSADVWPLGGDGPSFMQARRDRARQQALRGRREVAALLRTVAPDVPVRGVAVLWSAHQRTDVGREWRPIAGVTVVLGSGFDEWLRTPAAVLAPADQLDEAWRVLETAVREHEEGDPEAAPRATFEELMWRWLIAPALGALAAANAIATWFALAEASGPAVAGSLCAVGLGWTVSRRSPRVRPIALGWTFASLVATVLLLVAVAR